MQFMIDTENDRTVSLRAIARLIDKACDEREAQPAAPTAAPTVATIVPPPPPAPPADVPTGPSPAEVFGDPSRLPESFKPGVIREAPPPPPPTAPQSPPPTVEVDSAGAAYDANIHSSSRAKTANGQWKKRRGGPRNDAPPPPPMPPATAQPPPVVASAPPSAAGTATPAAVVPPPPPPPAPAAAAAPTGPTFRSVVAKAANAQATGKIAPERVIELCKSVGVPDLTTLNAMPAKIPDVDALLDAELLKAR